MTGRVIVDLMISILAIVLAVRAGILLERERIRRLIYKSGGVYGIEVIKSDGKILQGLTKEQVKSMSGDDENC